MYIRLPVTPEIRCRAKERADAFDANPYTWRQRPGRLLGFIGEEVAYDWLSTQGDVEWTVDRNNYDILFNGLRLDIKTKERDYTPRSYFEVSVPTIGMGTTQNCDAYLGVSVNPKRTYDEAWLVGWLYKDEFFANAAFFEKQGTWSRIPTDRYNVEFSQLRQMDELVVT